ncbi:MAG: GGDEF domain-containing protein [Atopobiaceae bacterium]|nr:GGDEF domain-containing protein [Atopobiaceae bacterium]
MKNSASASPVEERYEPNGALRLRWLNLPITLRVALSAAVMGLLVVIVSTFSLPNPNMILIAGLVVCSAIFGVPGGAVSAAAMMGYTVYFFSTDHSLVSFTPQNFMKVAVTAIGVTVVGIFVCTLKSAEDRALADATAMAVLLREDNLLLQEASLTDVLTGLRNRFALRRDYSGYAESGRSLHVMMMDLDDFKGINDAHGHETGDLVLKDVGSILLGTFGPECSYRYGGDEFLVIASDWTDDEFDAACKRMRGQMESLSIGEDGESVLFSGGYVCGSPRLQSDLRLMMRQADDNLYKAKREGKDMVVGSEFDRATAQALVDKGRSVRFGDHA